MIRETGSGQATTWFWCLPIIACVLAPPVASAQYRTVGTVIGRVVDTGGLPLSGVEVELRSGEVTTILKVRSDDEGDYRITDIVPRDYTVTFRHAGVEASRSVAVRVGGVHRIDLVFPDPPEFTGTVEVIGVAPAVETSRSDVSRYLIREEIEGIPVQNRTFNDLLRIVPGFQAGTIVGTYRNVGPRDSFNVHGARANQNDYLLDGLSNNDRSDLNSEDVASVLTLAGPRSTAGAGLAGATFQVGAALQTFNLDAVEEVQVQTSLFPAEFGDGSGSVVSVITRSGSDDLHAAVTIQGQREDFLEGEPQQEFTRAQYAGSIGGAIARGSSWYFVTYERDEHDLGYDFGQNPNIVGDFLRGLGLTANRTSRDRLTAKLNQRLSPANRLTVTANVVDERADVLNSIFRATVENLVPEDHTNRSIGLIVRDFHLFRSGVELESIIGYAAVERSLSSSVEGTHRLRYEIAESGLVFVAVGPNSPSAENDITRLEINEKATFHSGNMSWKVGGNIERFEQTTRQVEHLSLFHYFGSFDQLPVSGTLIPEADLEADVTELACFVQNDWYLRPGWTLNLGLRYQYDDLVGQHAAEPRLGAAFSPGGGGRSVLRFGVGLYHDRTNLIGHTGALRQPKVNFKVDQITGDYIFSPAGSHVADPDLELPEIAKWVVGYERQIAARSMVGVHVFGSHSRNLFYTEVTNRRDSSGVRADPSTGDIDVYTNTGSRDVYDVELLLRHVFGNGSLIQASYTFEDSNGNSAFDLWSGNHPLEAVAASVENGPVASVEGPLDHEVEHAFKLSAVGRLPLGFQVSGFLDWHTGLPFTVRDDYWIPWTGTTFVDGYNAHTMDSYFNLDLRVGWQVAVGGPHRLEVFLDVFNVTDEENVLDVDGVRRYNLGGNGFDPADPYWVENPRFLEPLFVGPRRSYQLGVRWSF